MLTKIQLTALRTALEKYKQVPDMHLLKAIARAEIESLLLSHAEQLLSAAARVLQDTGH